MELPCIDQIISTQHSEKTKEKVDAQNRIRAPPRPEPFWEGQGPVLEIVEIISLLRSVGRPSNQADPVASFTKSCNDFLDMNDRTLMER
jgi:hypothetical protein